MTETQFRLGKPIEGAADRDAIHIAVVPVTLVQTRKYDRFERGQILKLIVGTTDQAQSMPNEGYEKHGYGSQGDGVLDPFMQGSIEAGQRVWMFLYPNTVQGMRHHWTHPRFDAPETFTESETWLRRFADRWGMDYDRMISEAQSREGDILAVGRDLHGAYELDPGDEITFWSDLETLTGKRFDQEHRESICWTCTC